MLDKGHIQQLGTPQQVYRQPCSRFVAEFIGEGNFIDGEIVKLETNRVVVKTAIGLIVSSQKPAQNLALKQLITLSIRPESIRLDEPPAGVDNRFSATLHDTLYLGEMAQHQAKLSASAAENTADINFKLFEQNPKINARDQAQAVRLWFAPEDVVVLAA